MTNQDVSNSNDYYVYILANASESSLYVGVTNDLERRLYEHRNGLIPGFTERYNVHRLVYYETTGDVESAILREKQLKGWRRSKKERLIDTMNPERRDLSADWD